MLHTAITLAERGHAGQTRRGGEPYFNHVRRVAMRLAEAGEADEVVAAGYLHDVVEDRRMTLFQLVDAGIPQRVLHLVGLLTKGEDEDYITEFLPRIKADPDALKVKLADIVDNASDAHCTRKQLLKYGRALVYLLGD